MKILEIKGNKIRLRDWCIEDVDLYRYWQSPGAPWQALDGPYYRTTVDESERLAEDLRRRIQQGDFSTPRMRLVIAGNQTNQLIGTVSSYWESVKKVACEKRC